MSSCRPLLIILPLTTIALLMSSCGGKSATAGVPPTSRPGGAPTDDGHLVPWTQPPLNGGDSAGGAELAIQTFRAYSTPCICCVALPPINLIIPLGGTTPPAAPGALATAALAHANYQSDLGITHEERVETNPNYVALYFEQRIRIAYGNALGGGTPTDIYTPDFIYYENVPDAW